MKLPSLPDLDLDDNGEVLSEDKKQTPKKKVAKKSNKKTKKHLAEDKEEEKESKRGPRIPKSEYDSEGNPILAIPDLNDVELKDELERFFGEGGE